MPLDLIAFYGAGYQIHAENLAAHLAGRERGDSEARWAQLKRPQAHARNSSHVGGHILLFPAVRGRML
jgi:hypothetical protein